MSPANGRIIAAFLGRRARALGLTGNRALTWLLEQGVAQEHLPTALQANLTLAASEPGRTL